MKKLIMNPASEVLNSPENPLELLKEFSLIEEDLLYEVEGLENEIYKLLRDKEKVEMIDNLMIMRERENKLLYKYKEALRKLGLRIHAAEDSYTQYIRHIGESMDNRYFGNGVFLKKQ